MLVGNALPTRSRSLDVADLALNAFTKRDRYVIKPKKCCSSVCWLVRAFL